MGCLCEVADEMSLSAVEKVSGTGVYLTADKSGKLSGRIVLEYSFHYVK